MLMFVNLTLANFLFLVTSRIVTVVIQAITGPIIAL